MLSYVNKSYSEQACFSLMTESKKEFTPHEKLGVESDIDTVFTFFKDFSVSEKIKKGSATHGVLAQTSWLTGLSAEELEKRLDEIEDVSDLSTNEAAKAFILQTSLITNLSLSEVISYMRAFPDTVLNAKQLNSFLIMQTALIAKADPHEVIQFFNAFPRASYSKRDMGYGLLVQFSYLTRSFTTKEVNSAFTRQFPFLFVDANKAYAAIFKQTALFAGRGSI